MPRPGHPHPPRIWEHLYRQRSQRYPQARPPVGLASRRLPELGTRLTLYLTRAHLDIEGEAYTLLCERHGEFVTVADRALAWDDYKRGSTTDFCERCRANEYMLKRLLR